jgi:rRNA-processing protein FCF1
MASDRLRGDPKEKTVILDSSAVLMLFEFSIDLEDELTRLIGKHRIILPSPIVEELRFLSEQGKGKQKQNSKAALELIKRYEIVDEQGSGDDSALLSAQRLNGIVITNDRELRKRVKAASLQTIYLRGKNRLALE